MTDASTQALDDDLRSVLNLGMDDSDDSWNDIITDQIAALRVHPWLCAQLAIDGGALVEASFGDEVRYETLYRLAPQGDDE